MGFFDFFKKKEHVCNCPKILILTKEDIVDWKKIKTYRDLSPSVIRGTIDRWTSHDIVIFVCDEFNYIMKNRYGKTGLIMGEQDIKRVKDIDEKIKNLNLDIPQINLDNI